MLMPTKPETLKTFQEVALLEFLRDTVIPFVKEREKEGKVDLDQCFHLCGTPSCLLGWATTFHELGINPPPPGVINPWDWADDEAQRVFGIPGGALISEVFGGPATSGTLDDRAKAITKIIERKIAEAVS